MENKPTIPSGGPAGSGLLPPPGSRVWGGGGGLTRAASRMGWLPLLHNSRVILKAGPRPLTEAFRLKDPDDDAEVEAEPCKHHGNCRIGANMLLFAGGMVRPRGYH